jgi:serine/threonine-protein kinase
MAFQGVCCRAASAVLACALVLLPAQRLSAQGSADDKAAAEALFDQGIAHMREGKLEQACGELERSQSLERGIGTMLYLAECYEKLGRNASAWALFREAASVAAAQGEAERARVGAQRADRLAPTLSRLTLQVPAENKIDGFELTRNGQPVRAATWAVAVPVDPGQHVLAASAPGRLSWSQTVTVRPGGERLELQVPALAVDPNAAAASAATPMVAPPPAEPAPPLADAVAPPAATTTSRWPVQRTIALIVGGVGVVGLGIGGYFGARAISKNGEAEDLATDTRCPEDDGKTCGDPRPVELTEQASDAAALSTVFMIGGGVLAATGIVLFVTASEDAAPEVAVRASPRDVRVTVGGAF